MNQQSDIIDQTKLPFYPYIDPYEPPFFRRLKPQEVTVRRKYKRVAVRTTGTNPDQIREIPLDRWEVLDLEGLQSLHRSLESACNAAGILQLKWNKQTIATLPDPRTYEVSQVLRLAVFDLNAIPNNIQVIRDWMQQKLYKPHFDAYADWIEPLIVQALADRQLMLAEQYKTRTTTRTPE